REDATNRDTTRTRARIRLRLLPMLEKQFQPAAVEHLCQLAELAREDNEYLEMVAANRISEICPKKEANFAIAIEELAPNSGPGRLKVAATSSARGSAAPAGVPVPLAIAKRLVRHLVARAKPQTGELGTRHVAAALQLAARGQSGKVLQLPGGVEVRR